MVVGQISADNLLGWPAQHLLQPSLHLEHQRAMLRPGDMLLWARHVLLARVLGQYMLFEVVAAGGSVRAVRTEEGLLTRMGALVALKVHAVPPYVPTSETNDTTGLPTRDLGNIWGR